MIDESGLQAQKLYDHLNLTTDCCKVNINGPMCVRVRVCTQCDSMEVNFLCDVQSSLRADENGPASHRRQHYHRPHVEGTQCRQTADKDLNDGKERGFGMLNYGMVKATIGYYNRMNFFSPFKWQTLDDFDIDRRNGQFNSIKVCDSRYFDQHCQSMLRVKMNK